MQVIKAGEGVIASNQSANRDENVFKDAPNFNIHNDAGMQLGFGHGTHACIAQWLARAELQCVFGERAALFCVHLVPNDRSAASTPLSFNLEETMLPSVKLALVN
jgi:cytochrome P450